MLFAVLFCLSNMFFYINDFISVQSKNLAFMTSEFWHLPLPLLKIMNKMSSFRNGFYNLIFIFKLLIHLNCILYQEGGQALLL